MKGVLDAPLPTSHPGVKVLIEGLDQSQGLSKSHDRPGNKQYEIMIKIATESLGLNSIHIDITQEYIA